MIGKIAGIAAAAAAIAGFAAAPASAAVAQSPAVFCHTTRQYSYITRDCTLYASGGSEDPALQIRGSWADTPATIYWTDEITRWHRTPLVYSGTLAGVRRSETIELPGASFGQHSYIRVTETATRKYLPPAEPAINVLYHN